LTLAACLPLLPASHISFLPATCPSMPALPCLQAGTCDGLTYADIAEQMPHEYAARRKDKLRYRRVLVGLVWWWG
jgi:broad specificity phosphatase PhoE